MKTAKFLITLISLLFVMAVQAETPKISCKTPRMNKSFVITKDKITFFKERDAQGRALASLEKVKTKLTSTGFTKAVTFEGQRYTIHINDVKKFDEVEDYLSIKSGKGHEITYPLLCEIM